jgi:biopolymer transport protein TolR
MSGKGLGSRRHRTALVHGKKKVGAPDVRNEINVTPLVDVCLVLLIIFMVVTPMLTRGMDVQLPKTRHHNEKRDAGEQPIVSVTLDGAHPRYWYDRDALADVPSLRKRVEEELRRKGGQRIFLKADVDLKFGAVYPALMAIHEAGSPGVELGVAEIKEK